jgi:hypothetical protein
VWRAAGDVEIDGNQRICSVADLLVSGERPARDHASYFVFGCENGPKPALYLLVARVGSRSETARGIPGVLVLGYAQPEIGVISRKKVAFIGEGSILR